MNRAARMHGKMRRKTAFYADSSLCRKPAGRMFAMIANMMVKTNEPTKTGFDSFHVMLRLLACAWRGVDNWR